MQAEERTRTRDLGRQAARGNRSDRSFLNCAPLSLRQRQRRRRRPEGHEARAHAERIGAECAAVRDGSLAPRVIEHGHVARGPRYRADRHATADDLGERNEIGFVAQRLMGAARSHTVRHDLVENEKIAVLATASCDRLAHHLRHRNHRDPRRHRIEQHGGEPGPLGRQDLLAELRVVVGKHDDLFCDTRRRSSRIVEAIGQNRSPSVGP